MIFASEGLSMMTTTSKSDRYHNRSVNSDTSSDAHMTAMQKVVSNITGFIESKNDIFHVENYDSDNDTERAKEVSMNSESNRDDDTEIE